MHISFRIQWCFGHGDQTRVEPELIPLLKAIHQQGSLRMGTRDLGLSYRHAWGLLRRWEQMLQQPLVSMERGRGRGSQLTGLGERLLAIDHALEMQLAESLELATQSTNSTLAEYLQPVRQQRLLIYASHGLAIGRFQELMQAHRLTTEFQTRGSLESLRHLCRRDCQVAGFHFPRHPIARALAPAYRQWLQPRTPLLLRVADRTQGLLVRPGNPKKIRRLKDLGKRSVRFINRQRESGTRTILDQLLADEAIDPRTISGYEMEEFTHAAVAAMVASGTVDTGFGIEAVSARFRLDFIPLLQETYLLALDPELEPEIVDEIRGVLRSKAFRHTVREFPGYDVSRAGEPISVDELLESDGED